MAAVLTVVNNSTAVSNGFYRPRFTMNVKGLDTRKRTLNLESAQFELHFENVDPSTNKLYVRTGDTEQQLDLLTGTYTNIEDLLSVINETLKNAKHQDIQFSYSRLSSRVSVTVPEGKTCTLKTDSPGLVLGIGEIATKHDITGSYTFPFAVDLSKGRRFVLLYTDLIGPSVEYEDNEDSRVLKNLPGSNPEWYQQLRVQQRRQAIDATARKHHPNVFLVKIQHRRAHHTRISHHSRFANRIKKKKRKKILLEV